MTNDFDELASAYVDGQATDAEMARVEADPELMAKVAELQAIAEGVARPIGPVDEMLKRRQLGAALAAFDDLAAHPGARMEMVTAGANDADPSTIAQPEVSRAAPVEDLAQRRADRATGRNGMPRWLGVAAALLAVAGGIGFVSQLSNGSDDDTSSAEVALDTESEGEDDASAPELARSQESTSETEAGQATTTAALAASDTAGDATSDAAEQSDDEAMEDEDAAETAPAAAEGDDGSGSTGGLFPDAAVIEEARQLYSAVPGDTELATLRDGLVLDPSLSRCATEGVLDDGRKVLGFVPVSIESSKNGGDADMIDGEVFFVEGDDGSTVLVDAACVPLR